MDEEGNELARFIFPWGQDKKLERNYQITRTPRGELKVIDEGLKPFKVTLPSPPSGGKVSV